MNGRNLIRFDWAIKRLLRNKADYQVLEGFLSELLKDGIKIQSILESEGNQSSETDKFNRVDLLVKTSKDELAIIEVQNTYEYAYFHRMAYGTSKAITEHIVRGETYERVKKVYSVNIVYFDLGQGDDYVYHGKTDFIGIHNGDKLMLSPRQAEVLGKIEPSKIFPEYYVIKVNKFDDIAKDTLDQWIYYLKNNEIKDEFTALGIAGARELWRVGNLSEQEYRKYDSQMENMRYYASMASSLKHEAEYEIRQEERRNAEIRLEEERRNANLKIEEERLKAKQDKLQIARVMKQKQMDIGLIIELTGLTKEEINGL